MQQVMESEDMSVILLTDEARKRALSVVCDADISRQLLLRLQGNRQESRIMLPEALLQLLPSSYEMLIAGVFDGQYQVILMDTMNGNSVRIRIGDAVLLSIISHVPLYIEERLMGRQSAPFDEQARGVQIPINILDNTHLQVALDHAVEDENYELASQLRDEINRRRK